ncbi:hypothetical protein GCM10025857_31790 [Alicyclobacillus contaminans]|uniref:hypothetical protein n=1 Tax=Alicyclobacillus contaminans TaxID=392016 RepID=UPI0003FEA682|nr:hypothetical protein [Alicyclobacillus contaminans]GMA51822.1 hypothetical protein GCM10025857_31790 [Alicyclobacillus contaminans]
MITLPELRVPYPSGQQVYMHQVGAVLRCELLDETGRTLRSVDVPIADLAQSYIESEDMLRANRNRIKKVKRKVHRAIAKGSHQMPSGAEDILKIPFLRVVNSILERLFDEEVV